MSRSVTPVAFARAICEGCQRLHHDPWPVFQTAQITAHELARTTGFISAHQLELISTALMQQLDDEALGWFRRRLPWGTYGMLARASLTAPSLGIAIKLWCKHHGLVTDDIRLQLHTSEQNLARISLEERCTGPWLTAEMREFCHVSTLRNLMGLCSWLVDSRLPLVRAEFGFLVPPHADTYEVLFPSPCSFGHDSSSIFFPSSYLQLPLCRDETALRKMLQRALPLTVHTYRKDRLLVDRVKHLFRTNPDCMRNAERVASALNVSTRSLHRQLKEQGTSLQELKNRLRIDWATDLLTRTDQPIKKIALVVGFENDKGFIRAFKTHTGVSPGAIRPREPM